MPAYELSNSIFTNHCMAKPLYFLPADDLVGEVLIPSFTEASSACCMMGFFSSEALSDIAPGLAVFINKTSNSFKLIVSPYLRDVDKQAIESGLKSPEDLANDVLEELLVTSDLLQQHTLKCLAYLVTKNRIEIKIAIMKDALFHPKVWLFDYDDRTIAAHGSSNMTSSGIKRNFEQISVSMSWVDPTQKYIVMKLGEQFKALWSKKSDDCIVVDVSVAFQNNLVRRYGGDTPPREEEFIDLYSLAISAQEPYISDTPELQLPQRSNFSVPSWLRFKDGPFAHQGQAVEAWCTAGYKGVLEMATGSGKTITAMLCAHRLFEVSKPLFIVVAAPYLPLIEQWCGEIEIFGLKPINLTKLSGAKSRSQEIQKIRRRLRSGLSEVEVVVVSHDTLCDEEFHRAVAKFIGTKMIVADEAHNLGRIAFIENTPDFFDYRLALSATPERQYDQEGTEALFAYFGPSVFKFSLQEAIGLCLVEYDYYVHPVYLTADEMDEWYELTAKIRQNAWRTDSRGPDDFLAKLLRDRRKLLETAKGKLNTLRVLLDNENLKDLRHTLIYATDKDPEQLSEVNAMLDEKGVLYHQLTAEETKQREKCQGIIKSFQQGTIQVLTAKRVLDEGVNIPQINKAYILASTTVERQWVQRRGRLLRTCAETGKTHSEIHDFLSLPPRFDQIDLDEDARSLIKSELRRIQEFARSARNAGKADGPIHIIDEMVSAVFF